MKIRNKFSPRVAFIAMSADDGRTQQHFAKEVNINNILAKYRKTGIITHVQRTQERYGPLQDLAEFAVNLDKVEKAKQSFEMLPAELRNKFNNSIPGFFDFITKEENRSQCEAWGILNKKEPTPVPPAAADPSPQSKKSGGMKKPPVINEPEEGEA